MYSDEVVAEVGPFNITRDDSSVTVVFAAPAFRFLVGVFRPDNPRDVAAALAYVVSAEMSKRADSHWESHLAGVYLEKTASAVCDELHRMRMSRISRGKPCEN